MPDDFFELNPQHIRLDQDCMLRALGFPAAENATGFVLDALPEWIALTIQKTRPRALVKVVNITVTDRAVQIENGPLFHGRLIVNTMSETSRAMLLLVTLGGEVSQLDHRR